MRKWEIKIVIFFALSIIMCECHILIFYGYPETSQVQLDIWLNKNYHYKLSVSWYIYELTNRLAPIIWFYLFSKICELVSYRLQRSVIVFTLYFITQLFFWVWSRNVYPFPNFIVYLYMAAAIISFYLTKKKGGKLINIEDY